MWQNPEKDMQARRGIIEKIINLLRQRKPDAPMSWLERLPQMAQKLEGKLYSTAPSLAEYLNEDTLKPRLQTIASEMRTEHGSTAVSPQPPPQQQQQQQQPHLSLIHI